MNKSNLKRTTSTQEGKSRFSKFLQVFASITLIVALTAAVFLSYSKTSASLEVAEVVPTDLLTKEKTINVSHMSTPTDQTDDTIDYTPDQDSVLTDTFEYQICDTNDVCDVGLVTVTVNPITVLSEGSIGTVQPNSVTVGPTALDDNTSVTVNTAANPTFVNIHVLGNDDFGADGPKATSIKISTDCTPACKDPDYGNAVVMDGPRSPDPAGITYLPDSQTLLFSDSEIEEVNFPAVDYTGFNVFEISLGGSLLDKMTTWDLRNIPPDLPINFSNEPSGIAFNPLNGKLYFADDNAKKLVELAKGPDATFNTADDVIRSFDTKLIGSLDPSGVTVDTSRGTFGHIIFVDEGLAPGDGEVYDIDLVDDQLDQSDPTTHFDVFAMGINFPEAIEFNPDNCSLFILSAKTFDYLMAETTLDGKLLRYLDTSNVNARNPSGLAYAPRSTGAPTVKHLYITARGFDNNPNPYANDGRIYEASFNPNAPPAVDAGVDQLIMWPDVANLDGTVTDGCDPLIPGVSTTWSTITKPLGATVTFGNAGMVDTTATFSQTGTYVLQLQAFDGSRTTTDQVTINVTLESNTPPVVNAGPDQTITLPSCANLDGTASDDGLPLPSNLTTEWSVVGTPPGTVTFGDHTAQDTTACFSLPGVYVLRLTASDGELSANDTVQIAVKAEATQEVWLPIILNNH